MSNNVTMTMQAIFTQRYTMQLHPHKTERQRMDSSLLLHILKVIHLNPPESRSRRFWLSALVNGRKIGIYELPASSADEVAVTLNACFQTTTNKTCIVYL